MVDERFSSESFDALGLDSEAAKELSELLADETLKEIHVVAESAFQKIIERLNKMGHNLKLEYSAIPGDISYRDDWKDRSGYHCKLRLGLDIIVSAGYAHLISEDEALLTKIE